MVCGGVGSVWWSVVVPSPMMVCGGFARVWWCQNTCGAGFSGGMWLSAEVPTYLWYQLQLRIVESADLVEWVELAEWVAGG